MSEDAVIRAGFSSNAFRAGNAFVDIGGTFTREDCEDLLMMLAIVVRSVTRQMNLIGEKPSGEP